MLVTIINIGYNVKLHYKMALVAQSTPVEESNLGIKVEGDLGDFQIIEDKSDSDDENNRTDDSITLPSNLVQSSGAPIFGSVAVNNSDNVHFGNNTYFMGPVIIKQAAPSESGIVNASYIQTDDDNNHAPRCRNEESLNDETQSKKAVKGFEILLWHKLTFTAMFLIVIAGICAILSIIISNNSKDDSSTNTSDEGTSGPNHTKVVGSYESIQIIILIITSMPLFFLLISYSLLTKETLVVDKNVVTFKSKRKSGNCEYTNNDSSMNLMKRCKAKDDLFISPNHLRIVSRTDWLAQPVEGELDKIIHPIPWVIIQHTATENCSTQSECVLRVRLIQMFHIESRKWFDIGYNFLVAGDGSAYYGRGWDHIGAHTLGYNKYSVGIAFIGTFNNDPPPRKQLDACEKLIKRGVELGKLAKDYKLFAHRQLTSSLSPGDKLFDIIKEWPHFVKNFTDISELLPDY